MTTSASDQCHVVLLMEYGLDHGKNRGKTLPWEKTTIVPMNPLEGAHLLAEQERSIAGTWGT